MQKSLRRDFFLIVFERKCLHTISLYLVEWHFKVCDFNDNLTSVSL